MNVKRYSLCATVCIALLLGACGNTRTRVNSNNAIAQPYAAYQIEDNSNTYLSEEVRTLFKERLDRYLKKYGYQAGEGLTISYNILDYDAGNRALRYFVGFGAGRAKTQIRTRLRDQNGNIIMEFDTYATLSMGIFGGSDERPIINTAKDIAKRIARSGVLEKHKSK